MTPLDRLRVAVHRACEAQYGKDMPKLAGQIVVSKSLPPCSCPDMAPFYTVTVIGLGNKDRHWVGEDHADVIERATVGVKEAADAAT